MNGASRQTDVARATLPVMGSTLHRGLPAVCLVTVRTLCEHPAARYGHTPTSACA